MTEFYTDIAEIAIDVVSDKYVGGPSFTGQRVTPSGLSTIVSSLSARTIYFIPAKLEDFKKTFPNVDVFQAPWYGFAVAGVDLQAGDIYTDGTLAYSITGQPALEYGFVLAPATQQTNFEAVEGAGSPLLDDGGNILLGG